MDGDLFEPRVAVLTGIGEDHVLAYGSKAAIAREKRALLERLGPEGVAVVNADDELARATARRASPNRASRRPRMAR